MFLRNMKKSLSKNAEMKCSVCGKITKHFLDKDGNYRCLVCNTINASVPVSEVVFEADEEFDTELNPKISEESADITEG